MTDPRQVGKLVLSFFSAPWLPLEERDELLYPAMLMSSTALSIGAIDCTSM